MKHNDKDYISFPRKYNDFISLGFGKFTDLKPSELGLKWEIMQAGSYIKQLNRRRINNENN
jgi:hypothetical protein